MPNLPYILAGSVFDTDGSTRLSSIRVYGRNERSNNSISVTTNSNGEYALDAANFSGGYVDGDVVTVFVVYSNAEDYEEHTIAESSGGVTGLNLTLVEVPAADQLRLFTVQDYYDFFGFISGDVDPPNSTNVVKVGVMVEGEIDEKCSTRFSDGSMEVEVDDCDATTGWSGSTDATAIAVTTTDGDFRTRTGALDLGKSGTTEAFFSYTKSTLTQRSFLNRYVLCWVYMSSLSTLATTGGAVTIRYGTNSSNYYSKAFYKDDLVTGWNLLFFKKGDDEVNTTGTPTDSNMQYFQVRFDNTATSDTVTSGAFILDNIFLVHEDHFADEYFDTNDTYQIDYFLKKIPVDRLIRFQVNRADEGGSQAWDEITEEDNELRLTNETGRVRVVNLLNSDLALTEIFPSKGAKQVRATYIFGKRNVPKDIKKLAILMTGRDMMQASVGKALIRGQDSFKTEHYGVLDKQIDSILMRYRTLDMRNT